MWSVGISTSESDDAARLGYDKRQINRIVIRLSQFFLGHNMQIIFGHDWREDGVMQAVANYAEVNASHFDVNDNCTPKEDSFDTGDLAKARMINVAPTHRARLSRAALAAERDSGGILKVIASNEVVRYVPGRVRCDVSCLDSDSDYKKSVKLTALRHCLTAMLAPGCRICLGGKTKEDQECELGVIEEAKLALIYEKPLYLVGGFGGATRRFGDKDNEWGGRYWEKDNGLSEKDKDTLFQTTDVERAIRLILSGINSYR